MNVGAVDRFVRLVVGAALALVGWFLFIDIWRWVLIVVGAIVFLTGIFGFCLLYVPLGINTCGIKKKSEF